jgi:hypothetical protein
VKPSPLVNRSRRRSRRPVPGRFTTTVDDLLRPRPCPRYSPTLKGEVNTFYLRLYHHLYPCLPKDETRAKIKAKTMAAYPAPTFVGISGLRPSISRQSSRQPERSGDGRRQRSRQSLLPPNPERRPMPMNERMINNEDGLLA